MDKSICASDPERPLRHRAFFQAAGQFAEGSYDYRVTIAGLLVLRLLDNWPRSRPATARANQARLLDFVPAQRAVEHLDDTPTKRALSSLVDSISRFSYGELDARPTRLITYARLLEQERYWELAADVYATAIALLSITGRDSDLLPMCYARSARCLRQVPQPREALRLISTGLDIVDRQTDADAAAQRDYWRFSLVVVMAMVTGDLLIRENDWSAAAAAFQGGIALLTTRGIESHDLLTSYERAAYCLRQIGRHQEAADLLHAALETAHALQDFRWSMYLRISHAAMVRQMGDLSEADVELEAVIADARAARERDILGRALHDRGLVAHERHRCQQAITLFQEAAGAYVEERMKHRALTDVAMVLGDLGELDGAREAWRLIRNAVDLDLESRAIAGLNLLEIAWKSGDRVAFDSYRTKLARERMPARLRGHFHLFVGQGLRHFEEPAAARTAFDKARTLARHYHLHKLQTDAEAMLSAIDR